MNQDEVNVNVNVNALKFLGVLLFLGLVFLAVLQSYGLRLRLHRLSKKFLAEYYQINKRTLNNWIDCFLPADLQSQFHHRKNIPIEVVIQAMIILGSKEDFPVLNRKTIIMLGEGNYHQLKKTVQHHGKLENLPLDRLSSIRTFPPCFGKIVAFGFGLHPSEIESYLDK